MLRYLVLLLFALPVPGLAQFSSTAHHIAWGGSLPANCKVTTGDVFFLITGGTAGTPYYCSTANTWSSMAGGGGGGLTIGTTTITGGSANALLYQNATGATLNVVTPVASAVLVTNGSSVPSESQTLPAGLTIPGFCKDATFTAGSVLFVGAGPVCEQDAGFVWYPTTAPSETGMTGLQIGLAEPDFSACCDGPTTGWTSVMFNAPLQQNIFYAGNLGAEIETDYFRSFGTVASPSNVNTSGVTIATENYLAFEGGDFNYIAGDEFHWDGAGHGGSWELNTFDDNGMNGEGLQFLHDGSEFLINSGAVGHLIGFAPLGVGHGEFNNGAAVSQGGSLAQLDLATALVGNATASTPAIYTSGKLLASGTYHGNPSVFQMSDGTGTSGNFAKFNADGRVTDGGTAASFATYATATNCASGASPAVCGSAAAGSVAIPTGVNPTLVVNSSAVTANSEILLTPDDTRGTALSVTCNSTLATITGGVAISARTAATSFTISFNGTITTNPVCLNYEIIN